MSIEEFAGWVPARISWADSPPRLEWQYVGDLPFVEPMFSQSLQIARNAYPARPVLTTPIDILDRFADDIASSDNMAFVFHMSRCGSTLVSRMLSTSEQTAVVSEPAVLGSLLAAPTGSGQARHKWLRGLVRALDRRRWGSSRHFVLKFTSWHINELPKILKAFPGVRWCFLIRDPIEVMVSVLNGPTWWMQAKDDINAAQYLTQASASEVLAMSCEEYCARVLTTFCRSAIDAACDSSLFLNYQSLPAAVWTSLAGFFGMNLSSLEIEKMRGVATFYSKDVLNRRLFNNDSLEKRLAASEAVRSMAQAWLDGPMRELEVLSNGRDFAPEQKVVRK